MRSVKARCNWVIPEEAWRTQGQGAGAVVPVVLATVTLDGVVFFVKSLWCPIAISLAKNKISFLTPAS